MNEKFLNRSAETPKYKQKSEAKKL